MAETVKLAEAAAARDAAERLALGCDRGPRPADFPQRLERFLKRYGRRRFRWGKWDCCIMAARWVEALRGVNVMADFLEHGYASEAEAEAALDACAGTDLEGAVTQRLGPPRRGPLFAQRGDIVMVEEPDGRRCLGICRGDTVMLQARDRTGLVARPLEAVVKAWPV